MGSGEGEGLGMRAWRSKDADDAPSGKCGHTSFHGKSTSVFRITKKLKSCVEPEKATATCLGEAKLGHPPAPLPPNETQIFGTGLSGTIISCLETVQKLGGRTQSFNKCLLNLQKKYKTKNIKWQLGLSINVPKDRRTLINLINFHWEWFLPLEIHLLFPPKSIHLLLSVDLRLNGGCLCCAGCLCYFIKQFLHPTILVTYWMLYSLYTHPRTKKKAFTKSFRVCTKLIQTS